MRNLVLSASLLMLAACAAGGARTAGTNTNTPATANTQTTQGAYIRPRADATVAVMLPFPMQAVYDALPAVYNDLGITEVGQDPTARTVGNGRIIANRTFAGQRLSHWLSCGTNTFGNEVADNARIELSVRTTVAPDGATGSSVRTLVEATARNNRGTSADVAECGSTGRLETRITNMLQQRLASGS